jgi:hypothetical protein
MRIFEVVVGGFFVFAAGYLIPVRVMAACVLRGEFIQPTGAFTSVPSTSWLATFQRFVDGLRLTVRH